MTGKKVRKATQKRLNRKRSWGKKETSRASGCSKSLEQTVSTDADAGRPALSKEEESHSPGGFLAKRTVHSGQCRTGMHQERERERKEERIEGREKRSGRKRNEREGSCRDS